jgi:hypothetical protein
MPLVDITNDIKRSLKQNNQKNGVVVVANQKSHLLDKSPSHLKRISVAKTNEDDEEEQQPPTRARDSSRLSAGSGSSPFSKVSVEGPGEFLESEPSLSAKSDDLSNGNRRGSSGSEASVEQREERRTEEEEEEEEKQPVVVQQLRQSRRQKHQPQRLGDLLEWNDIKSNALYEKYDPEKEQRLLEQVQMEKEKLRRIEEEEKSKSSSSSNNNSSSGSGRRASGGKKKLGAAVSTSAASSSSYQSGHQSQAVMEVHQRVADLMKMAEQMLPPEEEEEVDDGLPKKSIREKLRDAWDGDGYYAKLMKEQDGPSSSSSYSSSNGDSNNNNSSNAIKKTVSKANNNNGKKEGLKVYCDKENPVAHKVNRAKKAGGGLGGGGGLSSSSSKLAVGCGNNATTIGGLANSAPQPLVQRTALASALGNVTNNASSSSSSNNINNTISGTTYMFGNLKSIQAPSNLSSSSTHSLSSDRSTSTSPSSSSSASAASSAKETNETLLALKAENDLLRKQRNDVKLQHLKLKKELDDLKKNARIAVSKLCAKLPNNSRGVELDALAFLKLN